MSSQKPNPYRAPVAETKTPNNDKVVSSAPCPSCQNKFAEKITFTIWGGLVGPKLFKHSKCTNCGTKFNYKTGKSNLIPIVIYTVVGFLIGLAIVFFYIRLR